MGGCRTDAQPEDILGFQFVCRGVELVRERGRSVALNAGDIVLWDGLQPTDVEIVESFYKRTLLFPRERVLAVCPRLADVRAMPPLDHSGPARLLVRYVNALVAEFPGLEPAARTSAANAALELLRAAIEPNLPTSRSATREAMRAEIRRYVRTHLQDPALDPASIARAYSMSVRALHALFEDADASVAGLVRSERLARCLEDLQRPNAGSVTEIAFRWGFCDAAHFSRVFKREFGATPSEIRRAALIRSRVGPGALAQSRRADRPTPSITASGRWRSGIRSMSIGPLMPVRTSTVREPPSRPSAMSIPRSSPITASFAGRRARAAADLGHRRARRLADDLRPRAADLRDRRGHHRAAAEDRPVRARVARGRSCRSAAARRG